MRFSTVFAALLPAVFVSAQQTFTVIVGGNQTLTYNPTSVNASVGDTIAFQFQAKNHTVTQSTFAVPCSQMTTPTLGVDSGFMPVAAGATSFPQWSFTVNNASAPLWFFCRQTGHCAQGMVFAINPTAAKTFDAFKANAMATASNTTASSGAASPYPSTTGTGTGTGAAKPSTGAAIRMTSGAGGLLAIVGVVAGLTM